MTTDQTTAAREIETAGTVDFVATKTGDNVHIEAEGDVLCRVSKTHHDLIVVEDYDTQSVCETCLNFAKRFGYATTALTDGDTEAPGAELRDLGALCYQFYWAIREHPAAFEEVEA